MTEPLEIIVGNKNYSSWSLRGWLAVARSGLPFREIVIPMFQEDSGRRIAEHSPTGKVPCLRHGDLVIWDSLAIGEYVAELAPAAHLWPADRAARAVARSACAEMHSGFAAMRNDMTMNIRAARPGVGHTPAALADAAAVQARWRQLRARWGAGGEFLFGRFTLADCFYAPVVTRFDTYGVELDPESRRYADAVRAVPELQAWCAAAREEPWTIAKYEI
ncbi:MAG TPA: glutathione S-transferase family protein [Kofleriaceae bacterium]|nr:glutathione S-transferase family protein [Kofleriaceae bacterium]